MELSSEVRTVVREAKNRITTCKTIEEFTDILSQFVDLVICSDGESTSNMIEASSIGIRYTQNFKKEFLDNHFSQFCEYVLRNADPKILDEDKGSAAVLRRLFLEGPADLSFLVLASSISFTTHTKILYQIVSILDSFASSGKFVELLFGQCNTNSRRSSPQDLLLLLASLPDQLANRMKLSLSAKFHPNSYYRMLGNELLKALDKVHDVACRSAYYTTSFLSQTVGKVALRGSVDTLLDIFLPQFKKWSYISPLWASLCSQTLMEVPESALEPVLEALMKRIMFYPFFCKIVQDYIHTKPVVKLLITNKFLFVRHYKEPNVLQNIVGYLCGAGRRGILMDILRKLLNHWGNYNTIKHSSYAQHLFITQAIILSSVQANEEEITEHKQKLLHVLLSGVQTHLENPNIKIRQLGMITAECMTSLLHSDGQKLKFEYEEDDDIKRLKLLAKSPKFGTDIEKENFLENPGIISEKLNITNQLSSDKVYGGMCSSKISQRNHSHVPSTDGDDDDDLQPYEISEEDDNLIEGIHPPRYISECIDGLLSSDDHKRFIASLQVLKRVISSDQDNLRHLSVQLVTVLLHLQDKYSLDDYNELRFGGMVDVTVKCPVPVAEYLTREFYASNYSLRQRMDILDVLMAAAAELSRPLVESESEENQTNGSGSKTGKIKNWQVVIEERIKKKTKRFSTKSSTTTPKATANRFAPVAGYFFFPLLHGFDSRQNTFNLLGKDCIVLGSLVCTVGNIMYCTRGSPIAQTMAKSLLEFVWVLRYHDDAHVRQALLFALAMAVLSVPHFFLTSGLQDELIECQSWLENVLSNDPSIECRNLAMQVLLSVRDAFKAQFSSSV